MSNPSQHPRMQIRDDGTTVLTMLPDTTVPNKNIAIIASVCVGVVLLLVVGFAIATCIVSWVRRYRQAKAAKAKTLADQKAWFASTRPVVHQPTTPRLLDAFTMAPHIQRQESASAVDLGKNEIHDLQEKVPSVHSQIHEKMRASCDLGLQGLNGRQSSSTVGTHASIGVAVPVKIPATASPTEVYNNPRS